MNQKTKRWTRTFIIYAVTLMPWVFVLSLPAFYMHASLILGRTPGPSGYCDPKDLVIYDYYFPFILPFLLLSLFVCVGWIAVTVIYFVRPESRIKWLLLLLGGAGYVLEIILLRSDIFTWYMD